MKKVLRSLILAVPGIGLAAFLIHDYGTGTRGEWDLNSGQARTVEFILFFDTKEGTPWETTLSEWLPERRGVGRDWLSTGSDRPADRNTLISWKSTRILKNVGTGGGLLTDSGKATYATLVLEHLASERDLGTASVFTGRMVTAIHDLAFDRRNLDGLDGAQVRALWDEIQDSGAETRARPTPAP